MPRYLHESNAMGYIMGMTNAMESPAVTSTRELIAANLDAELARQRWTKRKAAAALGLSHVYVSRRAAGEVELSGSDLVMFSAFLSIPVSRFFVGLPDLDSNQEPIGFTLDVVDIADWQRDKVTAHTAVASDRDAKVTQFPHAAGH